MLNITDTAKGKILELMRAENRPGLALRFGVQGRGPQGFQYRLAFVDAAEKTADDTLIDAGDLKVLVDAASIPDLNGATLDSGQLVRIDPHSAMALDLAAGKKLSIDGFSEKTPAGLDTIMANTVNGTEIHHPPRPDENRDHPPRPPQVRRERAAQCRDTRGIAVAEVGDRCVHRCPPQGRGPR